MQRHVYTKWHIRVKTIQLGLANLLTHFIYFTEFVVIKLSVY